MGKSKMQLISFNNSNWKMKMFQIGRYIFLMFHYIVSSVKEMKRKRKEEESISRFYSFDDGSFPSSFFLLSLPVSDIFIVSFTSSFSI